MKQILIAGTVAFDEVTTPFGHSGKMLGGSATYLSFASAFFDNHIGIVSIVGNDFPEDFIKKFTSRNIDIAGLFQSEDHKTFYWKGYYYENMNKRDTLVTEVNALAYFNPVIPENFNTPDILVLGNLHPGIQAQIINQLKNRPELIVLDTMNFWMDHAWDDLIKVISRVDLIMINEEEARQLSHEFSLPKAARVIMNMGPKYVIIKQGEYGSMLFHPGGVFSAPALPLEVVKDPTGAGDTFAGGFAGHLSYYDQIDVEALKNAMIYGANLASFTVQDFGTNALENITKKEIQERLNHFVEMTKFSLQTKKHEV